VLGLMQRVWEEGTRQIPLRPLDFDMGRCSYDLVSITPVHIADNMSDHTSVYESRLRQYVAELLRLDGLDVSPQWKGLLAEHDLEYWCLRISAITLPQAKILLAGSIAPTKGQLLSLPGIGEDHNPGVYYGLILTPQEPNLTYAYAGSATRPGFGLEGRTSQHSSPQYRASTTKQYQKEGKDMPYYYRLIDQPNKRRY
jgi:hypothetical protein